MLQGPWALSPSIRTATLLGSGRAHGFTVTVDGQTCPPQDKGVPTKPTRAQSHTQPGWECRPHPRAPRFRLLPPPSPQPSPMQSALGSHTLKSSCACPLLSAATIAHPTGTLGSPLQCLPLPQLPLHSKLGRGTFSYQDPTVTLCGQHPASHPPPTHTL